MKTRKNKRSFRKKDYESGDGMLTHIWGPAQWHFMHTMSFNYPVNPTNKQRKEYKQYILSLQNILPCKHCRINLKKNLKTLPLTQKDLENRSTFSRWVYELHEHVNKMLGKQSGLSYADVRDRYEHFRARCTKQKPRTLKIEKGCTDPMHGKKSKCILKIVPHDTKCETFTIDKECINYEPN